MGRLQANQQLIDQFNTDEQILERRQRRRLERRLNHAKLGAMHHAILDMLDELDERKDLSVGYAGIRDGGDTGRGMRDTGCP